MIRHKLSTLQTAILLCISLLPLCFSATCPEDSTSTLTLSVTEDYGLDDGSSSDLVLVQDFEEPNPDPDDNSQPFIDHNFEENELVFNNYFQWGIGGEERGKLYKKGWIDREVIANDLFDTYNPVKFEFDILVYNFMLVLYKCLNVTLYVHDLDDNTPMFPAPTKLVTFPDDNEAVGERTSIPIAVDDDEGVDGTSEYVLVDDSGKFELVFENYTNSNRVRYLYLRNVSPLDHEQQPSYELQLYAREGNDDPDETVLTINVEVVDSCDERAMFTTSRYTPSISEAANLNALIIIVEATDNDDPNECILEYSIPRVCGRETVLSNCQTISSHPFNLDSESGRLTLIDELDRESIAEYEITVQASDSYQSSTAMVIVSVEDINDNDPVVVHNILPTIEEQQMVDPDRSIGHFTVSDADAGRNGQIFVKLIDNSTGIAQISQTFRLITQNQIDYQIILNRSLDYETQTEFSLIIQVQDNGTQPRFRNKHVTISIEDYNDHPPEFVDPNTGITIPENSVMNTEVTRIEANDEDSGTNAIITFSLPPNDENYPFQDLFTIESEIGLIKVGNGNLDYEDTTNYTILVEAKNSESEDDQLTSTLEVTIWLENINDIMPDIMTPESPYEGMENAEQGEIIGQIIATDEDNLEPLIYSITTFTSLFSINDDGVISLEGELDFETRTSYDVTVNVYDGFYTASAEVTISVLNVNDERPVFNHLGAYTATVQEESQQNEVFVTRVVAVDEDNEPQDIHYTIEQGEHMDRFRINSNGEIFTTESLDREATPNYTIWIQANDGEFSSELQEVIIIVTDINDNTPYFINQPYNFGIEERNSPGEFGVVEVISLDVGNNQQYRFELAPGSGNSWFSIDHITGVLTTNHVFDHETDPTRIELSVIVSDMGTPTPNSNQTTINIYIIDENDNSPMFENEEYEFVLQEDYPIGHVFGSVVASDLDGIGNNQTRYSFSEGSDSSAFHIELYTGELSLVSSLDYETTNFTTFDVIATDEGRGDFQESTTVIIIITNARDLNLTFPPDFSPHFTVTENVEENHVITSVEVTDTMLNSVDRLNYTLTTENSETSPYFGISKEGYIAYIYTRTHTIDREADDLGSDKLYRLILNVSDPDTTPDTYGYIVSYITIEVLDENDNDPTFLDPINEFSVLENGDAGEMIAKFEVVDPDAENNGTIHLSIDSVVPFNVTHEELNNGQQFAIIRVVSPLDRETQSMYQFFLQATDQGDPNRQSNVEMTVHVTDVNDNNPEFCEDPEGGICNFIFTVREDHPVQEEIARVHAIDHDDGTNAEIHYEFVPGLLIGSRFTLEASTGRIILGESLDSEMIPDYTFEVRAVDGGNRASTASILLKVEDVNEYPPAFTNSSFTTTIPEDITSGVPFTSLIAVDQDIAPNALIRYALADESLGRTFCLDETSGKISICHREDSSCDVIDYEYQNEYTVNIIAYDSGSPPRYSNRTLNIQITNVNEHTPLFDVSELHVFMSENAGVGSAVLEIKAYDLDTADNLHYSLSSGTPFNWDSERNAIVLSSKVDYDPANPIYTVQLSVDDGQKSSYIFITVFIKNENNHPPVFNTAQDNIVTISENTEKKTSIFSVHATDSDNSTHDPVIYSIADGNIGNVFYINPRSGLLYVAKDLDYENQTSYRLTIIATDTGEPALESEPVYVTIELTNENDEKPIFEESEYLFNLIENNDEMALVGCVEANDRDEGEFGDVVYSIVDEGEIPGFFSILKNTGCILAIQIIDREMENLFHLTVRAQDSADLTITDTVNVDIVIDDLNDNGPVFSHPVYLFYINPDHDITRAVDTVTASDSDFGENSSFDYGIILQDPPNFVTLSDTGEVRLVADIPTNYESSYSVTVRTTSSVEGDDRYDDATIIIHVESETSHHPRFTQYMYEEHVTESADVGFSIFDASRVVTDEDGTSGLTYEFVESYEQFALDSETGLMTLQEKLNYEEVQRYDVQIRATDATTRAATATLTILVEDGNDHAPMFIEPPTSLVLSPVPYTDIEIFTVLAMDDDIGDQGTVGYSIVEESSSVFEINPESGVVTNRVNLITNDTYVFVIRAFDHGSPLMSSNITVSIRIDDSSNPPLFTNGDTMIDIAVPEDKNSKTDPVIQGFSTQPVAESYHLVYSNATQNMFGFDTSNNLVLNTQLDYETASQYLLIIEARSISDGMRLSSFMMVNIIVTDVNDNEPYFVPTQKKEISELQSPNTVLFTVQAMDDDLGENADITYAISDGNVGNAFDIDPTTGSVTLIEPLDREMIGHYNLIIRATDGGEPVLRNETTICIEVTDVNDNPPRFSKSNYSISVFEYPHTIGDSIIQIAAHDPDIGSLSYYLQLLGGTFAGSQRNPSSDTFNIDFDTGNITLGRKLDREEIDTYRIRIEARDTNDEHTAVAYLTVSVSDVNDNAPMFSSGQRDVNIWELTPVDSIVLGRQQVTDRDIGLNSLFKYSLGDNWPAGNFKIDPWTGVIRVARLFEYNNDESELLGTVLAVDQGVPPRTGTMTVRVSIKDVNNFAPVLDNTHFSHDVSFDNPLDQAITRFNYSDDVDIAFNQATMLRIPTYYSEAYNLFKLTPSDQSAFLHFRRRPTENDIGDHRFRIEAIQQTGIPVCPQYIQATYAHVTITVHPTNAHTPTFPQDMIEIEIPESNMIGTEIFIEDLIATDADGNDVFYSITSENVPFVIPDPSNPTITISGHLDADMVSTSSYTITIQARDNGFPVKSSDVTLVIKIIDVNDLDPVFEETSYSGMISENSEAGIVVLKVTATDSDSDSISYYIEYSEDCMENCFPFNVSQSGDIFTVGLPIDYEERESYMFLVAASDGLHTSYVSVDIEVMGVNEYQPTFEVKFYKFTVSSDQLDHTLVGKVEANDQDSGDGGKLLYRFDDEIDKLYDVLIIVEASGEIFLNKSMAENPESNTRRKRDVQVVENVVTVTRTVVVEDSGGVSLSDTTTIAVSFDKGFFEHQVGTTSPADPGGPPFDIIIIVVIAVVGAIVVFVGIIVSALVCRRHSRNRKFKVEDAQNNETNRGIEMTTQRYCRNGNGTTLDVKLTSTKIQAGNSASGSERSYTGTADDEMDSGNEVRYSGHSPNLLNKPLRNSSPRVRSTSDLASSVGTDALHSQANEHPYTKAQLMRIYAANEELLDDNVSHDSVHMFGSEGGGEADGDLDINNLILQKINDLEDDEESTTIMDDDASTTYSKGRGTVLAGSVGNMDMLPAEDREDPLHYPDTRTGWIPPAGRPIDETIDEITAAINFASQEEPPPRRHGYDMGAYSHSQGPSLYNPSATQDSYIGIQQPKFYHKDPKIQDYARGYYPDEHQDNRPPPRERERDRQRYTNPSNRYGSASVLQASQDYHHRHPGHRQQHHRSQDLAPPYSKYSPFIPGARRHPNAYMTPTEGTDGTVTPQTALTGDHYYLSSSSTSLTSTNVSGNLSQPSRQPQMYH